MSLYTEAAADTLAVLTELGTTANLRRLGKDYDPVFGEATETVKLSGDVKALVLPVKSSVTGLFGKADNQLLEGLITGKIRALLIAASGAPFEPIATDICTIGGDTYTLLGCVPLSPAGTPILYKVAARYTPATPDSGDTLEVGPVEAAAENLDELVDEFLASP